MNDSELDETHGHNKARRAMLYIVQQHQQHHNKTCHKHTSDTTLADSLTHAHTLHFISGKKTCMN